MKKSVGKGVVKRCRKDFEVGKAFCTNEGNK